MNFDAAHSQQGKRPLPVQPVDQQENNGDKPPHAFPEHPQVQPAGGGGGSLWILWLLIFLIVIGGASYGIYLLVQARAKAAAAQPATRPISVSAEAAVRQDMPVYLNGLGTVTPLNTVAVHTRVDGQLVKVAYTEFQIVHHDPAYDDKTMLDLDKGDQDKSDLLVEVDPRPYQVQLDTAKGQLARDQAQLDNAKLDLERYQGLFAKTLATDQQVKTQQALVAQYEGTIAIDQAAIHAAQLELIYCHVRTPIDGRVGIRLVDVGNIVHAADTNPVAVITQLDPITVEFTLPEDEIPKVLGKAPDGKGLPVEAWNRDLSAHIADGTLTAIDNQVDPGTGTLRLRATYSNPQNKLFPNQFVNAKLLLDTEHDVVVVPAAAVQRSPSSAFVYVVKAAPKTAAPAAEQPAGTAGEKGSEKPPETVEMRKVKVGITEGERTVIAEGLSPGERVVTDGIDKIQNGSLVSVKAPRSASGSSDATQPTMRGAGPAKGGHGAGPVPSQGSADAPAFNPDDATPSPDALGHHKHRNGPTAGPATLPTTSPIEPPATNPVEPK